MPDSQFRLARGDSFKSIVQKQVVVVGGGPAGFVAAISAARNGAETLLVERFECLGGASTGGLVLGFHTPRVHIDAKDKNAYQSVLYQGDQVVRGIFQEIHDRLLAMGGTVGRKGEATSRPPFDPELMKLLADQMVQEAGVETWLQTLATDVAMEGDRVVGVVVENKSGRHLLKADVVIDCSGDGDVAALAGASFQFGRPEDGRPMAASTAFITGDVDFERAIAYLKEHPEDSGAGDIRQWEEIFRRNQQISISGLRASVHRAYENGDFPVALRAKTHIPGAGSIRQVIRMGKVYPSEAIHIWDTVYELDGTDHKQLTEAIMFSRQYIYDIVQFLRKYIPGFENTHIIETASQFGVRETRRIIGDHVLMADEIIEGRKFEDVIARGGRALNVHAELGGNPGHWRETIDGRSYDIPYRCLVPSKVEGLLVAGRCISVDHMGLGSVRGIPLCHATGEAAGAAAALAAKERVSPRQVDLRTLQKRLVEQGVDLGAQR